MARSTVVVFDESPVDEPTADPAGGASPGGRGVRGRWVRWWVWPTVLAVVLAGLAGAQAVVDARHRAAWFPLAETSDAVLRPLSSTLTVTAMTDAPMNPSTAAAYRDTLVGLVSTADGGFDVVAADVDTWRVTWRRTLLGPVDEMAPGDTRYSPGRCVRVPDEAAVGCLIDDSVVVQRGVGDPQSVTLRAASVHRLVVLDARTGAIRIDHELPVSTLNALALLPGLAVVAVAQEVGGSSDGGVDLLGIGLDDGVQRWRTTIPAVLGLASAIDRWLEVIGDAVAFAVTSWSDTSGVMSSVVTFVGADGTVLRTMPVPDGFVQFVPSGGERAVVVTGMASTTVVRPDGDVTLPAGVVSPSVDDGSLGTVWFTPSAALDADGNELWRMPPELMSVATVLVVRGTAYVTNGFLVLAIDGATGRERWRAGPYFRGMGQIVTDGSVLGVSDGLDDHAGHLIAFDLADGSQVWDTVLPEWIDTVNAELHMLVGQSREDGTSVVLR